MKPDRIIALLHGPDVPGLVSRVSGWIFERGGNIIHADQHRDEQQQVFFQRVEWDPATQDQEAEVQEFEQFASGELGMTVQVSRTSCKPRLAVMVSRIPHCFEDFLLRWRAGDFHGEVVCVLSNHSEMEAFSRLFELPFYHLPICEETRAATEARQLEILEEHAVDLVVMARYMQVLSGDFLSRVARPVINVHHSFLPAFAGGKPYHQAYRRGVKIIGATAHYATEELDQGPIIAQEVTPVNHRHSVSDLIRNGRDLEKTVLAKAVRWHLESRVLAYQNKTVVFD